MSISARLILAACAAITLTVAAPSARAGGTCTFDAVSGVAQIQMTGLTILRAESNRISLDDVACGAATITNTDTIQITGAGDLRLNMLSRPFAPGRTPEGDGASEIEINMQTTGTIRFDLDATPDVLVLAPGQGDFFGDGDLDDFTFAGGGAPTVISAGGGDDLIDASALAFGVSVIYGGSGDDEIAGGRVLYGNSGNDVLVGVAGGTRFYDGPGDDIDQGGAGDDIFFTENANNGADRITGGGGVDTVLYTTRSTAVQIALDGVNESGELDAGDPVERDIIAADVENADSGPGDDIFIGNALANRFFSFEGNDILDGAGGDDFLDGDVGNDELTGGDGNDVLRGQDGDDIIDGGAGDDDLIGKNGDDQLLGGDGADLLNGGFDNDKLFGGEGNDELFGSFGSDLLEGGGGLDQYRGGGDSDHINAPADGFAEELRCGGSVDTYTAGPEDTIDQSCEIAQ